MDDMILTAAVSFGQQHEQTHQDSDYYYYWIIF